jgi:excisionase family DNA binding protein
MAPQTAPPAERKAVRPSEFARLIGVSRAMGYRIVQEGRVRSVRVGRAVLVPMTEVDRLLAADEA